MREWTATGHNLVPIFGGQDHTTVEVREASYCGFGLSHIKVPFDILFVHVKN